jgi:glycosyltransferase involved in cell wall biosynthesis
MANVPNSIGLDYTWHSGPGREYMVRLEAGGLSDQPTVEVLLATYNGERFLREQIDSILTQDYVNLRVLARDDGSSDATVGILNEYAQRFPSRFRVMPPGPGTGSPKDNFLLLMRASSAQYIGFSDQDDIWLPDKVSRTKQAMDELESRWGSDTPLLVFTDAHVVDDQLRTVHESFWTHARIEPDRIHDLALLLGRNVVTGCTMLLNRRLLELSFAMPSEASMHDRWIGLLACATGKACVVKAQTLLYRQHDRNVAGIGKRTVSLPELLRRLVKRDARQMQWAISQRQAEAFLRTYAAQLSQEHRVLLRAYLQCGARESRIFRITTFIRYGFYRCNSIRDLAIMIDI